MPQDSAECVQANSCCTVKQRGCLSHKLYIILTSQLFSALWVAVYSLFISQQKGHAEVSMQRQVRPTPRIRHQRRMWQLVEQ